VAGSSSPPRGSDGTGPSDSYPGSEGADAAASTRPSTRRHPTPQVADLESARTARLTDSDRIRERTQGLPLHGRTVGRYRIVKLINHGGMGSVYQALDPHMERLVALKVCRVTAEDAPGDVQRFRSEVTSAARLAHDNIVQILDSGTDQDLEYFTMEFVDGWTLGDYIRQKRPSFRERARIVEEVAEAVQHAHEHGILHRDIKPGNVLIDQAGKAYVTDFGLAKQLGSSHNLTLKGEAIGTPYYMPPEQATGNQVLTSFQSDVWGIGAVLYETLTGKAPFLGETAHDVLKAVIEREPVRPRTIDSTIPKELEAITLKCLEKEIPRRFQRAGDLADDLGRYLAGDPIRAKPPSLVYRTRKYAVKHRRTVATVSLILALLAGSAWWIASERSRRTSEWKLVAIHDFTTGDEVTGSVTTADMAGPVREVDLDARGLALGDGRWLVLERPRVSGEVRIEAEVAWSSNPDRLTIALNTGPAPLPSADAVPRGHIAVIDNHLAGSSFVTANRAVGAADPPARITTTDPAVGPMTIVFQHLDDELGLLRDGEPLLAHRSLVPLAGTGSDRIALRTSHPNTRIRKLRIYRRPAPEFSPPIAKGNALADHGHWADAAEQYLQTYREHTDKDFAPLAIAKAYSCARIAEDTELADECFELLEGSFSGSPLFTLVLEDRARELWLAGKQHDAVETMERVIAADPGSRIVEFALAHRAYRVAAPVRERLFALLGRRDGRLDLDCSDMELRDLDFLAGLEITRLDCSGNRIDDLSPLGGSRISVLDCADNAITDLGPLTGLPIAWLDCSGNPIRNLEPLADSPLAQLDGSYTAVVDPSPLARTPIRVLDLEGTPLADTGTLAGLRLRELDLSATGIASLGAINLDLLLRLDVSATAVANLTPLADSRIEILDLSDTGVDDLRHVAGLPLRSLDASRTGITDVGPLAGLTTLRSLRLRDCDLVGLGSLADLQLERLDVAGCPTDELPRFRNRTLHHLDCSRTAIEDLDYLHRQPLVSLDCSDTAVVDLGPLTAAPLEHLRTDRTRIAGLAPVAKAPLRSLSIKRCPIAELPELGGEGLRELILAATPIVDLGGLDTSELGSLDATGCRLERLPEAGLGRHCHVLATPELVDEPVRTALAAHWQRGGYLHLVAEAAAPGAWRRAEGAATGKAAFTRDGSRYLLIPEPMSRDRAVALAGKMGGALVSVDDEAELDFLSARIPAGAAWCLIDSHRVLLARRQPSARPPDAADDDWRAHAAGLPSWFARGSWSQAEVADERHLVVVEWE